VPGELRRDQKRNCPETSKVQMGYEYLSPLGKLKKGGANSFILNRPVATLQVDKLNKFYKELSDSSGEDISDNLNKLKTLFKKSNLEK